LGVQKYGVTPIAPKLFPLIISAETGFLLPAGAAYVVMIAFSFVCFSSTFVMAIQLI
jgi:hypothetical protein